MTSVNQNDKILTGMYSFQPISLSCDALSYFYSSFRVYYVRFDTTGAKSIEYVILLYLELEQYNFYWIRFALRSTWLVSGYVL